MIHEISNCKVKGASVVNWVKMHSDEYVFYGNHIVKLADGIIEKPEDAFRGNWIPESENGLPVQL